MTTDELAQRVADTARAAAERIRGTGAQQYANTDGSQQFEHMPLTELFEYAREELQDTVAYAVMLDVRLAQLKDLVTECLERA